MLLQLLTLSHDPLALGTWRAWEVKLDQRKVRGGSRTKGERSRALFPFPIFLIRGQELCGCGPKLPPEVVNGEVCLGSESKRCGG